MRRFPNPHLRLRHPRPSTWHRKSRAPDYTHPGMHRYQFYDPTVAIIVVLFYHLAPVETIKLSCHVVLARTQSAVSMMRCETFTLDFEMEVWEIWMPVGVDVVCLEIGISKQSRRFLKLSRSVD
ncbi:hypothetical protein CPB83DRAFT_865007 [Crepidotus variabilis]|uniref:Uncharacterized protein n=1 Tax=Crepidotus variabilis TaxID=179855 RepID=A0A9P6E405_9AGAR|nr:hypothetical protein CPB83DRAFT_865007 [Crepidotus variabilis]